VDFTSERSGTLAAEIESGRVLKPTLGTPALEGGGTCTAELHPLGIVKVTAWTVHTCLPLLPKPHVSHHIALIKEGGEEEPSPAEVDPVGDVPLRVAVRVSVGYARKNGP